MLSKHIKINTIATDGIINWYGLDLKLLTASFIRVPKEATGAGSPNPKKLK